MWMDTEANDWDEETMKRFIWDQNNYSYDGEAPVKHSAESLIRFCDMNTKEKIGRFNEVYKRMY